ncbi:MAG: polysaccharide deacetylase family protein [Peptococcaceae bacterium]|jgi:peptidoglycan/xylan/chitin deacetylase (PgdA/CDA1 family)|nr:polysaccharide deacetylase family protein [Peptococcaceae bacterium]
MPWTEIIIGIAVAGVIYTILPDVFLHRLGIGSWKTHYGSGVAITFDDGPDPDFTPRALDILAAHKVAATFFLVGEKARRYPELVRQIIAGGHQVGAHSWNHRFGWFQTPWTTWKEWGETIRTLESLTGQEISWVRPPWGTFNLALWLWMKKNKKRAVLWNAEGMDWKAGRTPTEITARLLKHIRPGAILLLHDSGGECGAVENMIQALPLICRRLPEEHKLAVSPLSFPLWTWRRRCFYRLWDQWERFYAWRFQIQRIDAASVFRLAKKRYQGPELYDKDGVLWAAKGDIIAELHLDNSRLQGTESDVRGVLLRAIAQFRESLPILAKYVVEHPDYQDVRVFAGLTLIHRGVGRLGFEVQETRPSWAVRRIGTLQKVIMSVYHPLGKGRNRQRLGDQPKWVWMSRQKLLAEWLKE